MRALSWVNHVLITLFAVSSGIFKVLGGQADLDVFSHLGMGAVAVAIFGAVQALGGVGLIFAKTVRPAAVVIILCNALATAGLFAAGIQPFGVISLLFVGMAALELRMNGPRTLATPPA